LPRYIGIARADRVRVARLEHVQQAATARCLHQQISGIVRPLAWRLPSRLLAQSVSGDGEGKVVAEGIKTNAGWKRLHDVGRDIGQGFMFAPTLEAGRLADRTMQWSDRANPARKSERCPWVGCSGATSLLTRSAAATAQPNPAHGACVRSRRTHQHEAAPNFCTSRFIRQPTCRAAAWHLLRN